MAGSATPDRVTPTLRDQAQTGELMQRLHLFNGQMSRFVAEKHKQFGDKRLILASTEENEG